MAGREDKALDELYQADLGDFTARRNDLAKRLGTDGDAEAAGRVKALKKPSSAAWALNRLSHDDPKLRKDVLGAGAKLRTAQEKFVAGKGDRDGVRAATQMERNVVDKATGAAAKLAAKSDTKLSPAALERVRQTLHAVALDDEVRSDFERHRLTTDHEAVGLGGLAAAAPSRRKSAKRDDERRHRQELKAAESEAAKLEREEAQARTKANAAREAAERAQGDLERRASDLERATAAAAAAKQRLEALVRASK
jgi:hypothetical protein